MALSGALATSYDLSHCPRVLIHSHDIGQHQAPYMAPPVPLRPVRFHCGHHNLHVPSRQLGLDCGHPAGFPNIGTYMQENNKFGISV